MWSWPLIFVLTAGGFIIYLIWRSRKRLSQKRVVPAWVMATLQPIETSYENGHRGKDNIYQVVDGPSARKLRRAAHSHGKTAVPFTVQKVLGRGRRESAEVVYIEPWSIAFHSDGLVRVSAPLEQVRYDPINRAGVYSFEG